MNHISKKKLWGLLFFFSAFQYNFNINFKSQVFFYQNFRRIHSPQHNLLFRLLPGAESPPVDQFIEKMEWINSELESDPNISQQIKQEFREILEEIKWLKKSDPSILKKLFSDQRFTIKISPLLPILLRSGEERDFNRLSKLFNYYTLIKRLSEDRLIEGKEYKIDSVPHLNYGDIYLWGWKNIILINRDIPEEIQYSLSVSDGFVWLWMRINEKKYRIINIPKEKFLNKIESFGKKIIEFNIDGKKIIFTFWDILEETFLRRKIPVYYRVDDIGIAFDKMERVNELFDKIDINDDFFLPINSVILSSKEKARGRTKAAGLGFLIINSNQSAEGVALAIIHETAHNWYPTDIFIEDLFKTIPLDAIPEKIRAWFGGAEEVLLEFILNETFAHLIEFDTMIEFFEKNLVLKNQHNLEIIRYYQEEINEAIRFLKTRMDFLSEEGKEFLNSLSTEFELIERRIEKIIQSK